MSAATAADGQQALDTLGIFVHPAGEWFPDVPLFMDTGYDFSGPGGKSSVNANLSGSTCCVGILRGLIDDGHYAEDGYRTRGDSFLWAHGDHWSMGPPDTGWPGVGTLVIRVSITRNDPSWHGLGVCGMQSNGNPINPEPWQLYVLSGELTLALRSSDGTVRTFTTPLPDATANADFAWTVVLATGSVTCVLNSLTVPVTGTLPAGTALRDNRIWGFAAGQITPYPAAESFWLTTWIDTTIHDLEVTCDGVQLGRIFATPPRPATYSGGPTLPLVTATGGFGGRWILAIKRGQNLAGAVAGVRIHDLTIASYPGCVTFPTGPITGGLDIDRVTVTAGSRMIDSIMMFVAYPIRIRACRAIDQTDCVAFLYGASQGSVIRDCDFAYARRCSLHLLGCDMEVGNIGESPGGVEPVASVIQSGGQVAYTAYNSDFEGGYTTYRMFVIEPNSWAFSWFPTLTTVTRCIFQIINSNPRDRTGLIKILRPGGGYAATGGPTVVEVDGEVVYKSVPVAVPGGAGQTQFVEVLDPLVTTVPSAL